MKQRGANSMKQRGANSMKQRGANSMKQRGANSMKQLLLMALLCLLGSFSTLALNCAESPCAQLWRIRCDCCEKSKQAACNAYIEKTQIKNLPPNPTAADLKECQRTMASFSCDKEPALNLRESCNPPSGR